jgi:hypothetical protein
VCFSLSLAGLWQVAEYAAGVARLALSAPDDAVRADAVIRPLVQVGFISLPAPVTSWFIVYAFPLLLIIGFYCSFPA